MDISKFDYYTPKTIDEVCRLLSDLGDGAKIMAGGTDIIPKMRKGLKVKALIDLQRIQSIDGIHFKEGKGLTIGAMVRISDVAMHPIIKEQYPAIAKAASVTANTQIRNMGTIAGNICNASPSADNVPTLIAMNAKATLVSLKGQREVLLDGFFKGPGITVLEKGEVLISIFVPMPPKNSGASYQKLSPRSKVDIASVSAGAMLVMNGEVCEDASIALGAVAAIPMRATEAEKTIKGRKISAEILQKAGLEAFQECSPINDIRTTAEYRCKMVAVLTARAIEEARKRALEIIK